MHADVCDKDSSMSASFYICFFPRDHPLWLDLCLPLSEVGYSGCLSLMPCFMLAVTFVAKKNLKSSIWCLGLLRIVCFVGRICLKLKVKWCSITAGTALRFGKFQWKKVLNNCLCLLLSAQILTAFISCSPTGIYGFLKQCQGGWLDISQNLQLTIRYLYLSHW